MLSMLFPAVVLLCTICDFRLGLWSIEASYSGDFTTTARTDFEVKEYGMECGATGQTAGD